MGGRIAGEERSSLLFSARPPQGVQQAGDAARVVEGALPSVRRTSSASACCCSLLPQCVSGGGRHVRVVEPAVGGRIAGEQRSSLLFSAVSRSKSSRPATPAPVVEETSPAVVGDRTHRPGRPRPASHRGPSIRATSSQWSKKTLSAARRASAITCSAAAAARRVRAQAADTVQWVADGDVVRGPGGVAAGSRRSAAAALQGLSPADVQQTGDAVRVVEGECAAARRARSAACAAPAHAAGSACRAAPAGWSRGTWAAARAGSAAACSSAPASARRQQHGRRERVVEGRAGGCGATSSADLLGRARLRMASSSRATPSPGCRGGRGGGAGEPGRPPAAPRPPPQGVQQQGDAVGSSRGRGRRRGRPARRPARRARLPQGVQQQGGAVRVVERDVGGGVAGEQCGHLPLRARLRKAFSSWPGPPGAEETWAAAHRAGPIG